MVVASGMRSMDTSNLPTADALLVPGQQDGQVMVVNISGRGPIAYQWSQPSTTWIEIGEAIGQSNKSTLDGVQYDHVTEVYLTEHQKVKLGFNKDDDPNQIVEQFMALYSIPMDMK
jgi:phospholipase A-2-activating protein